MTDTVEDMYPSDGQFLGIQEPPQRQRARDKEKAQVLVNKELLEEIIQRFEERITFYKSVDAIEQDIQKKPEVFQKEVEINRLTAQNLEAERTYLEDLIREHV